MSQGKWWSKKEKEYLTENWGKKSLGEIARSLKRTKYAVERRVRKMKLGGIFSVGEYFNTNQIAGILGKQTKMIIKWIKEGKLKGEYKFMGRGDKYGSWIVKYDYFINWLETNQDKYDARDIKEYALGYEPDWLKKKREKDKIELQNKWKKWSKIDGERLLDLYHDGKTIPELAERFGRTNGSIENKLARVCREKLNRKEKNNVGCAI